MSIDILSDEIPEEHEEASFSRRNLAGIIDAGLVLGLFFAGILYLPQSVLSRLPMRAEFCLLLLFAIYRLLFFFVLKATIGMRIAGIELLSGHLHKLSITEKFFASFFILINDVSYYKRLKSESSTIKKT
ncbi:MAG TPA: RDD family protein [Flavitalea sp.]|nr:RDD family protein [Flavitalea sp.]